MKAACQQRSDIHLYIVCDVGFKTMNSAHGVSHLVVYACPIVLEQEEFGFHTNP